MKKYKKVNQRNCYIWFYSTKNINGVIGVSNTLEKASDILEGYFALSGVLFGRSELCQGDETVVITAIELFID